MTSLIELERGRRGKDVCKGWEKAGLHEYGMYLV